MGSWDDTERAALVALLRMLPSEKAQRELVPTIVETGSALALLREHLGPEDLFADPVDAALAEARNAIAGWESEGITVLTLGEERYPTRLRDTFDQPPLLFARGEIAATDTGVAVVGSRTVSPAGRSTAEELARQLVEAGMTVVSGLAAGVDAAAHRAAIAAHGRTVAVIGTGIRRHYPPENRDLHRLVIDNGAVFSQFWPDAGPTKQSFPIRNGTMSGYSLATVVIEANERSGTQIQTRKAIEHGRPVVLLRQVAEGTTWGRKAASRPDVHVAKDADDAMSIIVDINNRPARLAQLIASVRQQ